MSPSPHLPLCIRAHLISTPTRTATRARITATSQHALNPLKLHLGYLKQHKVVVLLLHHVGPLAQFLVCPAGTALLLLALAGREVVVPRRELLERLDGRLGLGLGVLASVAGEWAQELRPAEAMLSSRAS
jgi:hypothetical protein